MHLQGLQQDKSQYEQTVLPSHVPLEGKALFLPFRRLPLDIWVCWQPEEAPTRNSWISLLAET
jgi:hypothetical protein